VAAKPRAMNSSSPAAMIACRRSAARTARLEAGLDAEEFSAVALDAGPFETAASPPGRALAKRAWVFLAGFVRCSVIAIY
jgi:hypothetical protein